MGQMGGEVCVEVLLYLAICIMGNAFFHWSISPITTSPFPAEASLVVFLLIYFIVYLQINLFFQIF